MDGKNDSEDYDALKFIMQIVCILFSTGDTGSSTKSGGRRVVRRVVVEMQPINNGG